MDSRSFDDRARQRLSTQLCQESRLYYDTHIRKHRRSQLLV